MTILWEMGRRIAVLGTGMAGYGAWHRLRDESCEVVFFDKNSYPGGHTNSYVVGPGFVFDEGPHVSFTKDERVRAVLAAAVDDEFEEVQYELDNYWRGHRAPHPVQCNLHGLPTELVTRVIADFVAEASKPDAPVRTYEDWLVKSYGQTFAMEFPERYTTKYHTTTSRNLTTDWIGPRMYRPSLEEVLRGALAPSSPNVHYITGFRYPRRGGFVQYLRPFLQQANLVLEHEATAIDPIAHTLRFANGNTVEYDALVSSIPLPELVRIIEGAPHEVRDAASRLACSTVVLVNVGVGRDDISRTHISYFYDEDVVFSRLSFPHLMAPGNAPPGTASIQAEVYFSDKYRPLVGEPADYIEPVLQDLVRCGVLSEDDDVAYKGAFACRYANVIFDHDRAPALEVVHAYLDEVGIAWCGRYGDWGHIWTDEAFLSGERAAELALRRVLNRAVAMPTT
jgi:protoporphyrinogen oxidase